MDTPLFDGKLVHSQRIIYTPSLCPGQPGAFTGGRHIAGPQPLTPAPPRQGWHPTVFLL